MQNQIKCVCFDLDDTLCDYSTAKKAACDSIDEQLVLNHINTRQFWDAYQRVEPRIMKRFLRGDISIAEYRTQRFSIPLEDLGINEENLVRQLDQRYREIGNRPPLFEDVLPTLAKLSLSGYTLAILTNGPKDGQMAKIGPWDFLCADNTNEKPAQE